MGRYKGWIESLLNVPFTSAAKTQTKTRHKPRGQLPRPSYLFSTPPAPPSASSVFVIHTPRSTDNGTPSSQHSEAIHAWKRKKKCILLIIRAVNTTHSRCGKATEEKKKWGLTATLPRWSCSVSYVCQFLLQKLSLPPKLLVLYT